MQHNNNGDKMNENLELLMHIYQTADMGVYATKNLLELLRKKDNRFLPDGKAQITGKYENDKLVSIKAFTICYQNTEEEREATDKILVDIVEEIIAKYGVKVEEYLINPTGRFCIGGFTGDAGLTGRKIVVDSYQSFANVGGGAFSGKDPTKVDRSGAYKAREIAKDIVKNGDYI